MYAPPVYVMISPFADRDLFASGSVRETVGHNIGSSLCRILRGQSRKPTQVS
jgi:hypothetical protein